MNLGRQWDSRLKIWDEAFEKNIYRPLGTLDMEGFTTMDFLSLNAAKKGDFRPFPAGTKWGRKWEYGWFRTAVRIPEEAAGQRVLLHLGAAEEMLVYVDGQEAGSIDKAHAFVEVAAQAEAGRVHEIYAECYAGHGVRREDGGFSPRETVPVPEPPEAQVTAAESHFGVWNEAMFQAYADYHTLYDLLLTLPDSSLRGMEIAQALKEFTYTADFELEEPARTESVVRAAALLQPLLQKKNGDTVPAYTVFGQSHLDLAWLWSSDETKRKCARTYSNQLKLMERYPEYRFLLCCPTVLENLKKYYPDLYRRVKEKYAEGAFLPEGALWVESDSNLPGGESLIRQFVKGKRWFQQEFGTDSRLAWLPDTFGFSGALPQIMAGCRVPYFATQKLLRSDPECEPFPYNNFWWEGIDGTRVLSHIYFENNSRFTPSQLCSRWEDRRNQKEHIDGMLFPFGYGDGGGGATEIMLETYRRCRDLEGLPRCTMESPVRYFERLAEKDIPEVYYGELYLAWHRGTYTAVAGIKGRVRRAESALREAEFLAGLLRLEGKSEDICPALLQNGADTPSAKTGASTDGTDTLRDGTGTAPETSGLPTDRCGEPAARQTVSVTALLASLWDDLLEQEFHDVLAGSSIQRVNEEAMAKLDEVIRRSLALSRTLLKRLAGGPAVFNSLSWERRWQGLSLPSCGYVMTEEAKGAESAMAGTYDSEQFGAWRFTAEPDILTVSNTYYTAILDRCGRILSLTDAQTGFEYAAAPLNELRMYQDVNIYYDAWEIGRMYENIPVPLESEPVFSWEEADGTLTAYVERREPHFTWRQRICFAAQLPEIRFETEVDWHERHRILKADFPTGVFTREVLEEIQFGYIRRPTHRSRRYEQDLYETCHHRYAALTDGANGLALINDGKYGLSAKDSRMSLTLLRAPAVPDMTADQGHHRFTYVLYPFRGPFQYSGVVQKGYEYNTAVTSTEDLRPVSGPAVPGGASGSGSFAASPAAVSAGQIASSAVRTAELSGTYPAASRSYFSVEGSAPILETCKPALDAENGVVLRLYEPMGMAGSSLLSLPPQVKNVWQCNMLEEKQAAVPLEGGKAALRFHAFEILTLLLEV